MFPTLFVYELKSIEVRQNRSIHHLDYGKSFKKSNTCDIMVMLAKIDIWIERLSENDS
jgi:hypothetical protein